MCSGINCNTVRQAAAVVGSAAILTVFCAFALDAQTPASPHDFTAITAVADNRTESKSYAAVCTVCHVPNTAAADAPAWDETSKATAIYAMYQSATMDATRPDAPSPESLMCLSCHDGTNGDLVSTETGHSLGTDLRDDHPVSMVYDEFVDPGLRPKGSVTAAGLKLLKSGLVDRVECPTCHNPHDDNNGRSLLRVANTESRMCFICHIK